METIKVIDLLNKIANGEEVPKKIHILNTDYTWNSGLKTYDIYMPVYADMEFGEFCTHDLLNNEVEIIEDIPKEIYFDEEDIKAEEEIKKLSIEKKDNFYDYYKEDKKIEKLDIYFNGSENKISIEDATDTDTQIEFVAYRLNDMIDEFYKLKEKVDKVNGE